MSQQVRQSNLFAAEDWETVYKSFKTVDFKAYDFDSIKQSLVEYVKAYYPEDFNDYIESSEYVAIIEMLAWLGTSLSFRVDLNSRENFLDTAERRDSIVRLARMLNYQPKRNIAAKGLFKITGLETTQPLEDSFGRSLQNVTVFWNDPNNPDGFDQFTQILNSAFLSSNPYGRPVKDGTVGDIKTSLYQLNNVTGLEVAYGINVTVNSESMPFDIVNPDFDDGETIYERHPDPQNNMHFIYRNDGQGLSSANTGFFLHFRQGSLEKVDNQFDFPEQNRVIDIDLEDINNSDVWVQEIDDDGVVQAKWTDVPALSGNNIAYNSISQDVRQIYSIISGLNDTIQIKFPDGNFGEVPTGIFRTWARSSINKSFVLRTDDARDLEITIPYTASDNQTYSLRVLFQLEENVFNSAPSETDEEVKENAPRVYYTQERMVNNQDYNVFPLTYGNQIEKLKSINRTHSGHSRFIDINDPTGVHSSTIIFAEDGSLYKDNEPSALDLEITTTTTVQNLVEVQLQNFVSQNQHLQNWFYDIYVKEYKDVSTLGETVFNIPKGRATNDSATIYWKTMPERYRNDSGYFTNNFDEPFSGAVAITVNEFEFMDEGAWINFAEDQDSTVIKTVSGVGLPSASEFIQTGPVEVSKEVNELLPLDRLLPAFRTTFSDDEVITIVEAVNLEQDFILCYDINNGGAWVVFREDSPEWAASPPTTDGTFELLENDTNPTVGTQSWALYAKYNNSSSGDIYPSYSLTTRGVRNIFESYKEVRFFYDPNQKVYDPETGKSVQDEIVLLNKINDGSDTKPLEEDLIFSIDDVFYMEDGHMDQRKVLVKPVDEDEDGIPENPEMFDDFVGSARPDSSGNGALNLSNHVFFENFTDNDGYSYFRPWASYWYDIRNIFVSGVEGGKLEDSDLFILTNDQYDDFIERLGQDFLDIAEQLQGKVIYREPTEDGKLEGDTKDISEDDGYFFVLDFEVDENGVRSYVTSASILYQIRHGRTSEQDLNELDDDLYFKWKHYAPSDNRIDPSISNIIDMVTLTNTYYTDIQVWKDEGKSLLELPQAPTTEELRVQFSDLNNYKMLSDQIVFQPAAFKIIFGKQAEEELQASFKVVKLPSSLLNENEIKAGVISAIDKYFDIANWDFGESFYYTELAAYIHQEMASSISSVVIVPTKEESQFGNLFQIKAESTELFLSTATVADVEIVANLTETNMRL